MGTCTSHGNVSPFGIAAKKLTREQIALVDKYLPDFHFHEASTEAHLKTAAAHWNMVFSEAPSSRSTRTSATSASTTGRASVSTTGRAASHAPAKSNQEASRIGVLYDTFYEYLGKNSPELQPIFRASMHVRSKVLLHISAGMRRILANEFVLDKILELTKTHIRFGVKLESFNALGKALIYAMKVASEDAWNGETEEAWRRMFAHCSVILMVHHKKAIEKNVVAKNQQVHDHQQQHHHNQATKARGPEADDLFPSSKK